MLVWVCYTGSEPLCCLCAPFKLGVLEVLALVGVFPSRVVV